MVFGFAKNKIKTGTKNYYYKMFSGMHRETSSKKMVMV
jgi:hypothetical protein